MTRVEVPGNDVVGLRAANPGPFTLHRHELWIVGRDPAWLIDPGPALAAHSTRSRPRSRRAVDSAASR